MKTKSRKTPRTIASAVPQKSDSALDINYTRVVKLDESGNRLNVDAPDHHAVYLPDFHLIFPNHEGYESGNWKGCEKLAASHALFGQTCRWASPREHVLIIDYSKYPAIDRNYFPKLRTDRRYWTSQKDALSPGCACCVRFDGGNVYWDNQNSSGFVLPVLRVAPGQF